MECSAGQKIFQAVFVRQKYRYSECKIMTLHLSFYAWKIYNNIEAEMMRSS